ncbi:hypothetical protein CSA37_11840 [Candidatus Fermentibacteria bacterium]|nr:MAG: hypothetical protein CSA37_11840 [Candidatus Fermentibacteria bacterium]
MLTWFRDNAKIFLIAIVVIFVGMIFLEWGRGGLQKVEADKLTVGMVNGKGLEPSAYDAARQEVYAGMENQMVSMGYPNAESQLTLLHNDINDAAFDLLIDRTLQDEFLKQLDWEPVNMEMAEELLKTQLVLMGVQDTDAYLNEYRNDPNYSMTLYQVTAQADRSVFSSAVSLQNMISRDELDFLLRDAMTTVTAKYIPFRASPAIPSDQELETFYEENTELFERAGGSRIRYATYMIHPGEEDLEVSSSMVDSLALAGAGNSDTLRLTRAQLETVTGWSVEMETGELSQPFQAPSMAQNGLQAFHSIELLSVTEFPEDTTGGLDTLDIVHWEVPVFPGRNTVRQSFWDLEEKAESLLAMQIPVQTDYQLVDYGEILVDTKTIPSMEIPQSLISFATDSIWIDSIGPVFYIPSFSGSYPALMVARKLEEVPEGIATLEEVMENSTLLMEYYTDLQSRQSLEMAEQALEDITASGMNLTAWAEADSMEVYDSQQFSPASVRQWAESEEAAYRGILGSAQFADAALYSDMYTVIGPFSSNGVSYLAEIVTRTEPQLPENLSQLAGFYLSMQGSYNTSFTTRLMDGLKENSEIVDSRESYYNTLDSLRAEYAARQEAQEQ